MSGDLTSRWYAPGTAGKSECIYDSDEITVDYRDGMLRISQFVDGHWVDEHFVEGFEPVIHAHWVANDDPQGWFDRIVYCSACKCGDSTVRSPRCRYCGAHMDEEVAE